jgi:hypothetical protein
MSARASGAVSAPPRREPKNSTPLAMPRSRAGNHCEKLRTALGNAPASPAPNRKRTASSERLPCTVPVSIVNADHHSTMRVSTRRGPMTSPSQPEGTSKSE